MIGQIDSLAIMCYPMLFGILPAIPAPSLDNLIDGAQFYHDKRAYPTIAVCFATDHCTGHVLVESLLAAKRHPHIAHLLGTRIDQRVNLPSLIVHADSIA